MTISSDTKFLVALHSFYKFGPARIKKIKKYFINMESAFNASSKELKMAGIEDRIVDEFTIFRNDINPEKLVEQILRENIEVMTLDDDNYPKLLSEIYDPPPLLYCKGKMEKSEFSLAVVGTRKFTNYGKQAAESIVKDLAKNNITIVSGLALGIDTIAHSTALNSDGRTIAVLGSGIDRQSIYPSSNRYLAEKIIEKNGLILSEFPLGTPPLRHHFPQRNRIISGLSSGTLVVEAGEKSGALITANFALEQNREVFAVPGNIYSPVSMGPNDLIKQGARAVSSAKEIMDILDLAHVTSYIDSKKCIPETEEEKIIISFLSHEPIHVDKITCLSKLNIAKINSALVIMEMKGMIKNLGGQNYILNF